MKTWTVMTMALLSTGAFAQRGPERSECHYEWVLRDPSTGRARRDLYGTAIGFGPAGRMDIACSQAYQSCLRLRPKYAYCYPKDQTRPRRRRHIRETR